MTLIALAALACAWLGYFVFYFKDDRSVKSNRKSGHKAFNRTLNALGDSVASVNGSSLTRTTRSSRPTVLFDRPRTAIEANRRRVHVTVTLATTALVALAAVPRIGMVGWVVHALAVTALVIFVLIASRRRHRAAEYEMMMLMMNDGLPHTSSVASDMAMSTRSASYR